MREAWRRLAAWLATSRYEPGHHAWLEELLALEAPSEAETRLKLLMPVRRD